MLKGFSWGNAFFDVNGPLLERYAQCRDAEQVTKVQDEWLRGLEREWVESRELGEEGDEWAGGNPNRRHRIDDYEEEEDENENDEENEDEEEEREDEEADTLKNRH